MKPMTAGQDQNLTEKVSSGIHRIKGLPLVRWIIWGRWIISISLTLLALLWSAYILGQDISKNLSEDYEVVQDAQGSLLKDAQKFRDALTNENVDVDLEFELASIREKALKALVSLGGLRAPSNRIEASKRAYREALEELVAVSNRIARGSSPGIAIDLHNALQRAANTGGKFNQEISYFQGGMWPQLKAAIF